MKIATNLICLALIFLGISAFYSNCAPVHSTSGSSASNINTAEILQNLQTSSLKILNNKCASCHNDNTTDSNLKDILDVDYLKSSGFIEVGSPQTSAAYLSIVDRVMPKSGAEVTPEELATLRDWIAALGGKFNTTIGAGDPPPANNPNIRGTFSQVNTILQQRCLNCHSGQRQPNLNLAYAQLINEVTAEGERLVVAGDVSNSRLYQVVLTNAMPQGNPLNNTQKEIIRTWIAAGAAND